MTFLYISCIIFCFGKVTFLLLTGSYDLRFVTYAFFLALCFTFCIVYYEAFVFHTKYNNNRHHFGAITISVTDVYEQS